MTSGASGSPGFIACPFCGLGCDDLTVAATAEGVAVDCQGCGLADGLFNRPHPPAPPPRIDGRPASAEEAAGAAARLLAGAARPLFAGLGTDVAGLRAAVALARRVGGSLDHLASAGLFRNMTVM